MPKLTFYRQKRHDGGLRTGVELDEDKIAERYDEGGPDRDPTLLWYVDLRCDGPGLPADPDDAFDWLVDHAPTIKDGFARFAETLRAGADPDIYSLKWSDFDGVPGGVSMTIACSATRRVDGRQMAEVIGQIGNRWDEILRAIDVPEQVENPG